MKIQSNRFIEGTDRGRSTERSTAARAGITRVLLPARNRKDFEEIPEDARKRLEFVWLEKGDDAIAAALTGEHVLVTEARGSDPRAA